MNRACVPAASALLFAGRRRGCRGATRGCVRDPLASESKPTRLMRNVRPATSPRSQGRRSPARSRRRPTGIERDAQRARQFVSRPPRQDAGHPRGPPQRPRGAAGEPFGPRSATTASPAYAAAYASSRANADVCASSRVEGDAERAHLLLEAGQDARCPPPRPRDCTAARHRDPRAQVTQGPRGQAFGAIATGAGCAGGLVRGPVRPPVSTTAAVDSGGVGRRRGRRRRCRRP